MSAIMSAVALAKAGVSRSETTEDQPIHRTEYSDLLLPQKGTGPETRAYRRTIPTRYHRSHFCAFLWQL